MAKEKYIYGNWKMNHLKSDLYEFFEDLASILELKCHKGITPQSLHLPLAIELSRPLGIQIGAQNCSHKKVGAFTGEISTKAIFEAGATFTLVGHSERRHLFFEKNDLLNEKVKAALSENLEVVFCIGETLEERQKNQTFDVLKKQLSEGLKDIPKEFFSKIILAYEPVWAIGTGQVATPEQADETHQLIRQYMENELQFSKEEVIILYGGSVKPSNAKDLLSMSNIDGALVGGASLKGQDFLELCKIAHTLAL